jgi:uncharacterized membrane protein YbhN (UPF0104 family)
MSKKLRSAISIVLVLITIVFAVIYIADHRPLITQLKHTPLLVSLTVLALYGVMFGVLMLILSASVRICRTKLGKKEHAQLNSHSLFINFFIPGQGGPAYRGIYLNKKHNLRAKNYVIVTLMYYGFYAVVSIALLLISSRPWWQIIGAILLAAAFSLFVINKYSSRIKLNKHSLVLSPINLMYLFLATVLQSLVQLSIYGVELHNVDAHIKLSQVITYTGAANLALFVSLTPGAIGIRETFLIFTEHLHHISSANIIVANIIDRSVYLVFLLMLLVITFGGQALIKYKTGSKPVLNSKIKLDMSSQEPESN